MQRIVQLVSQLMASPGNHFVTGDFGSDLADFEKLIDLGILKEAKPAMSVACDACAEGHVEEINRIVREGNTVYRIRCPEAGWVDVPKNRMGQWTFSHDAFVKQLSRSLPKGMPRECLRYGTAWKIGELEIGGANFSLILAHDDTVSAIQDMCVPTRTILLLPKMTHAHQEFAAALSVNDAVGYEDGFLVKVDNLRVELGIETSSNENEFRKKGEYWEVHFAEKRQFFVTRRACSTFLVCCKSPTPICQRFLC